jgi:hypothetical protein
MKERKTGYNSRFAKAGACFYESEVLNSSFVHLMKFSAKNPRFGKLQTVIGQAKRRHNQRKRTKKTVTYGKY